MDSCVSILSLLESARFRDDSFIIRLVGVGVGRVHFR